MKRVVPFALAAGLVALLAIALLLWRREAIAGIPDHEGEKADTAPTSTFAFLGSRAVWLCFFFFLLVTVAFGAIQNFSGTILQAMYGLSLTTVALGLSTYMLGSACGVVLGGFLTQKCQHDRQFAVALGLAALLAADTAKWARVIREKNIKGE